MLQTHFPSMLRYLLNNIVSVINSISILSKYSNLIGWVSVIFLCGSTICIWAIILIIKLIIKYEYIFNF